MKKSLLALAVLGAFAGAASAQTNVTIYGVADVGIARTDTNASSATWSLNSGNQSGSRIGFKGTEDLGGGLSAVFQLENGFNIDTGALGTANTLFNRQAYVGLKGGFGGVTFGRQYNPFHIAVDTIDPFETGLAGDASGPMGALGGYPIRSSNAIAYSAPAMGGVSVSAIYGLGEVAGSQGAGRQMGVGAGYANGPLNVQFAYHTSDLRTTAAAADADVKKLFLGAKFNFGVANLHAAFGNSEAEAAGASTKARNYLLGVSAPVGAGTVLASWNRTDFRTANAESDLFAIGYTHALSKRTNLYTSYGRTDNDAAVGVDSNVFNVGIRHKF
jgi:predicted porin